MQKEIITTVVASLPEITENQTYRLEASWNEHDGRAHFTATRRLLPKLPGTDRGLSMLSLMVQGPYDERKRVVNEFTEALGRAPVSGHVSRELGHHVDMLLWSYRPAEEE